MEPSYFVKRLGAGRDEATLIFLHATGLNASAYVPLLRSLDFEGQVLAPSHRGHGATTYPIDPGAHRSFQVFADDLVAALADQVRGPLILAGHSLGAVVALLAAKTLRPERVLMIEPVVLTHWAYVLARSPLRRWTVAKSPIARKAAGRRAAFQSKEEALSSYVEKRFFSTWQSDALAGYVDEGFRDTEEGVTLSCPPAWEAAVFAGQTHGFWPHLRKVVRQGTDVRVLAADRGSTFPKELRPRAMSMGTTLEEMAGSHMLPLEKTEAVSAWMKRNLAA